MITIPQFPQTRKCLLTNKLQEHPEGNVSHRCFPCEQKPHKSHGSPSHLSHLPALCKLALDLETGQDGHSLLLAVTSEAWKPGVWIQTRARAGPSRQWSSLALYVPTVNNMLVFYKHGNSWPEPGGNRGTSAQRPVRLVWDHNCHTTTSWDISDPSCSGGSPGQQCWNHGVTLEGIPLNTQVLMFLAGCCEAST